MAKTLQDAGFDLMSFANNHALDYGEKAFIETIELMHSKQISIAGAGKNLKERARIVKTNQKVKIIDKISDAEKKIKEGTKELKKLRETGHTKPIGVGKTKKYFPR